MTSVGVRKQGQRAPLPIGSPLGQMRAARQINQATADIDTLPQPLVLKKDVESPSDVLKRSRRHER